MKPRAIQWCGGVVMSLWLTLLQGRLEAGEDHGLKMEIIPGRDAAGRPCLPHAEPFQVRLTNLSGRPAAIWDDSCRLGHQMLAFKYKDALGGWHMLRKREAPETAFEDDPTATALIPPGKSLSLQVNLGDFLWGERMWENVPEANGGEMVEISAVLEIGGTAEGKRRGVWTGRVESPALRLPVINPTLKTPQDYLWNACPNRALQLLKNDPAAINQRDKVHNCTPLHLAARFGYKEVAQWLIQHGANVNATGDNALTPLHLTEKREIAELLIQAGADWELKDVQGITPLQQAKRAGHKEVVEAIQAKR